MDLTTDLQYVKRARNPERIGKLRAFRGIGLTHEIFHANQDNESCHCMGLAGI